MPSCSVKWCSNHTSTCSLKSKNGVSFHRFPKDEVTCQKWVEAVRFERRDPWWTCSNASRICSLHFKESDISSTPCKVNILAKSAVPVCTMVWYDDSENNMTYKIRHIDKTILKTYERKKSNMNVFKVAQENISNYINLEDMSKTNKNLIPNITSCVIPQINLFQELDTKLLKILEVSKMQNPKEYQVSNSVPKISFKSANANINIIQKKNVLTELNKREDIKSYTEKCCKSDILVKLNDNTRLILEDLSNDTKLKESNRANKELNTRTSSKKVTELKSNENKEPNQEVTNISNTDMFVERINNHNVELNANILNSYVGKMLKTYMPKRKEKLTETNKHIKRHKGIMTNTMEKGLTTVKYKNVNNIKVNIYSKDDFIKKLKTGKCVKNKVETELKPTMNSQENRQELATFKNVKKKCLKRSNLFNRPRIKEQDKQKNNIKPNIDDIEEFIMRQSRVDKSNVTDTVFDEIISELFDNPKNIDNVSDVPYNPKCQESNENICVESNTDNNMDTALDKETNNMHIISDLDTNAYPELNTLMDLELCAVNMGWNGEMNTEFNTNKTAVNVEINGNVIPQLNKSVCYNDNIANNDIVLSNNELQNPGTSVINNTVFKKEEFSELKKQLSRKPKLASVAELCTKTSTDVDTNLFSKYDNIMSISITKDILEVSDRNCNTELHNNVNFEVNDKVTSSQNNINSDATKETESNASNQLKTILLEVFVTNISSELNNSENMDFFTNVNTDKNKIREPQFNKKNISVFNTESQNIIGKDIPDLNSVMNFESCSEANIGLNGKVNTKFIADKTAINKSFTQFDENKMTESNQLSIMNKNWPIEHSDDLISELHYHFHTESNGNIITQRNKSMSYNENISNLETPVIQNLVTETKEEEFTELKIHLSRKPKLDSFSEPYTSTITNIDKSVFYKCDNIISTEITKKILQIRDKDVNIDVNDKKMISAVNIECKKVIGKDMPDLNTVIFSKLNEDQLEKSKDINRQSKNLNTEMYDKGLLPRKSNKDFENASTISEDQHIVVNEHMDVVDSILNRDETTEFDLSLLLSDTPIPDDEIQNVDNNSYNSLDGVEGSPNWIQLATDDMPKIIDDILDQDSPFFENLDLCEKVNKLNLDKDANKKDIKKPVKNQYSSSNFEQFEEQIINEFCETVKQSTKKSIAQIKKQLVSEFSDSNETSPEESNNICNLNKVSQSKKVTAEECYDLFDEQTHKQNLEQYLQPINEQCDKFNFDQIVDECYEHSDKEIQSDDKSINQIADTVVLKANQIEDPLTNQYIGSYFEETEEFHTEQDDDLDIENFNDEVLNSNDISELNKKQTNEQTYQSGADQLKRITLDESIPKSKIQNQGNLESNFPEINTQLTKDFNKIIIEDVNDISNGAYKVGMKSEPELNSEQLKKIIFEQCFDPECGNNCKNLKHNSNTELPKEDVQQYKKQTNITPCETDIKKPEKHDDLLYKGQCNQSSIDNHKKQLEDECIDSNIQHTKKSLIEQFNSPENEKRKTKYKKIAIDLLPGQYLELRWQENEETSNTWSQEECKRKYKDLGWEQRKIRCIESNSNNISQQIMAECPECGYSTDDNNFMNYQSDVDLRITKPLSIINKEMLLSLSDTETEKNNQNNEDTRVTLESVYAMELAYITAIQALERKLKQKIALSEYRLRKVNNLSKINNSLIKARISH